MERSFGRVLWVEWEGGLAYAICRRPAGKVIKVVPSLPFERAVVVVLFYCLWRDANSPMCTFELEDQWGCFVDCFGEMALFYRLSVQLRYRYGVANF